MQVDILIVGQGLSGSWLSYECQKAGIRVAVIDQIDPKSPSRLSAGIINPITGRRHVEVWLADQLLTQATSSYNCLGKILGRNLIQLTTLLDHFPSRQMQESFQARIGQGGQYVFMMDERHMIDHPFEHPHGIGKIDPVLLIDLPALLDGWRSMLIKHDALIEEQFDPEALLLLSHSIRYKSITADRIIFCDGTAGISKRFFPNLPFAPNKGEVLILDIPDLPQDQLYKYGVMLTPLSNGSWWCGSSYQWSFNHAAPTPEFRTSTEQTLRKWLKVPFQVIDHVAGIRPATLERRPFVGLHPNDPRLAILNGMGTKGCSLAPYFAKQLVEHFTRGTPIHPEASVTRFNT